MLMEPYQEARDAMTRISTRDEQIAPLAKMNREDWLVIGKALSEIKQTCLSPKTGGLNKKLFGEKVRQAGLDQGCCSTTESRKESMWFYENSNRVYTLLENTALNNPNAIHNWYRGKDLDPRIEQISGMDLIDFLVDQVGPRDDDDDDDDEPPVEISTLPKVATTEHPIVKSDRPPCPGVEGGKAGEYVWHNDMWMKVASGRASDSRTGAGRLAHGLTWYRKGEAPRQLLELHPTPAGVVSHLLLPHYMFPTNLLQARTIVNRVILSQSLTKLL